MMFMLKVSERKRSQQPLSHQLHISTGTPHVINQDDVVAAAVRFIHGFVKLQLHRACAKRALCSTQIIIIWHCGKPPPPAARWQSVATQEGVTDVPISVIDDKPKVMGRRFYPFDDIRYDVVLSLDDDVTLNVQEVCVSTSAKTGCSCLRSSLE